MKQEKDRVPEGGSALDRTAAEWFVELDAGPLDAVKDRELATWLERNPEHEAELARCEAAAQLARELQGDDELRWMFAETARLAETPPARIPFAWHRRPALAWGVAAAAVVVAVAVSWDRIPVPESAQAPTARNTVPAEIVRELAAAKPVVLSPDTANLVVDARSVAILPFVHDPLPPGDQSATGERIAATLYDDVMRELAAIPGVYVLERSSVAAFAERGIAPQEIAMQLSVRGVVAAQVAAAGGRVRVVLRIVDAAQPGLESERTFDRPTAELAAIGTDIVTTIAVTLAAPVPEPAATNEE